MSDLPRHQRPTRFPKFLFGVPYYPEHWRVEETQNDPRRMSEAGVNVVRMAEFAWDRMEPSEGKYDFQLFDATIARLGDVGIETILCTPTATPPRWLTEKNPSYLRVDENGRSLKHGSRQHCCTNHPDFRKDSRRITRAMAEHFRNHPSVIGWQTDNEFQCHFSKCYCERCLRSFRIWLQEKYRTVDKLNSEWGTQFWSQTYDTFEQIDFPYQDRPTYPNPGQELDYFRFLSDSLCSFQKEQIDILREVSSKWWITHNGVFEHYDYWRFAEPLDFFGVDVYPGFAGKSPDVYSWSSYKNEECRAASGSYIVPEQQGGAGGQKPFLLRTPPPGQMRLWAYQSIAHGADGILHFRWRTCRFGTEIYWNGILDHDNIPRRRYAEFSQEGAELKQLGEKILGTVLEVKVAVLTEFDQDEAHRTMDLGLLSPAAQRKLIYTELMARHLPAGLVHAEDSFAGLQMIIAPGFALMDERLAGKLTRFVEEGGTLVMNARTATRSRNNQVIPATPPGWLTDLFGLTVEEFGAQEKLSIFTDESQIPSSTYEILKPRGAEELGRWGCSGKKTVPHAAMGHPAICLNRYGKGRAIYVGACFAEENAQLLTSTILSRTDVPSLATAHRNVEVTCRIAGDRKLYFILNHDEEQQKVTDLPAGMELLSNSECQGTLELEPYGVRMISVGS